MKVYFYLILVLVFFVGTSCSDDDDFSSSSGLALTFSSKTINFDTVFTTIGSPTQRFKIYNNNKNSLTIQSIELMNPEKSGFRMNIDGEKGTKLTNVDILKGDSLIGFVEVSVNEVVGSVPLVRDSIRFITNGHIQYLYLEVVGLDVHIWKDKVITENTVLMCNKPYLVYNTVIVDKSATLTIEEGTTFYMKQGASIRVEGVVKAMGSIDKPIVFRGDRFDKIEGDIPYDNVPGQWDGIYFGSGSYGNQLENVWIRNASRALNFRPSGVQSKAATLRNVVVLNSSEYGLKATNAYVDAINCLFSNAKNATVMLQGGQYSFLHCTLANYFQWSSRNSATLVLSNMRNDEVAIPLTKCDFGNSIIYGSLTNEVLLQEDRFAPFNYKFANSLIKGKETSNTHFENVVWNRAPLFKSLNGDGRYSYNFELQKGSSAINQADVNLSQSAPTDLRGHSRLSDSNPDMGCYEWIE